MSNLKKQFGTLLKSYRKEKGLNQEQFAEKIGIAVQTLSGIENGHRFPSYSVLVKIAKVLDIPVYNLFIFDNPKWTAEDPELQQVLYRAFKDLDYDKRKMALKFIRFLSELEEDI
jgi:transcriptional regulator with XRE-family HTH domain